MKIAYVDCFSGASGDMLLGALVDAGASLKALQRELARIPLKECRLSSRKVMKGPVRCAKVDVAVREDHHHHDHGHHGRSVGEILRLIRRSPLAAGIKDRACRIFERLAGAEGKIHGKPPHKVHFHEVGAVDAIADIVGTCVGFDLLGVEKIYVSRFPLSHGTISCDHGLLPVPGPATLELLKGRAVAHVDIGRELVTPTGAAILTTLAEETIAPPPMTIARIGYGAGDAEMVERPNFLRILIGEAADAATSDVIWEIETNLDNVSGEVVGYLYDRLFAAGALDVFTTPIVMKKSRPAVKISVLALPDGAATIERILLSETPAFGVRRSLRERTKLARESVTVATKYGRIRIKVGRGAGRDADRGAGAIRKIAPEHDDCRAAAEKRGVPLSVVVAEAVRAYERAHERSNM